jgi:DNA recombination-mediator protein A
MQKEAKSLDELFAQVESKTHGQVIWFGITGSWRKTNEEIERTVRESVREIYDRGAGIVSGGALSVDFFATDEALLLDPTAARIKIFLPVTLERYAAHYRKRAQEGVITSTQAESLIGQLKKVKKRNRLAIIENVTNVSVDPTTYFERNTEVVYASDALLGFQVNESEGAGDTVRKAIAQEKPVFVKKYHLNS